MLVCALLLFMHTRPRVHRAPGIPARPLFGGRKEIASLEQKACCEIEKLCLDVIPMSQRHCEEPLRRSNPFLLLSLLRDGLLRINGRAFARPLARNDGRKLFQNMVGVDANALLLPSPRARSAWWGGEKECVC